MKILKKYFKRFNLGRAAKLNVDIEDANVRRCNIIDSHFKSGTIHPTQVTIDDSPLATKADLATKQNTLPTGTSTQYLRGDLTMQALNKAAVGLGNVDNTSDLNKPISTATQTALNAKANLASPALTGTPTAPTQASTDNSTKLATTAFVKTAITSVGTTPLGTYLHIDADTAPSGWVLADGRTLPTSYKEYYAKFPDGKVRDMRGRFLMSAQSGVYNRGTIGGASNAALTYENNGDHSHLQRSESLDDYGDGALWIGNGAFASGRDRICVFQETTFSGYGSSFSIMNPYLALPCYCYVGLVTTGFKAEDVVYEEVPSERRVSPLENGIAKFEYLNGNLLFTSADGRELFFHEEEIAGFSELLRGLKEDRLLCTLTFACDLSERSLLTNSMVRRVSFETKETSQIHLNFAYQDQLQELLNGTSFEKLMQIRAEFEAARMPKREPLEELRGQKYAQINEAYEVFARSKSFEEACIVEQKMQAAFRFIAAQKEERAIQDFDINQLFKNLC